MKIFRYAAVAFLLGYSPFALADSAIPFPNIVKTPRTECKENTTCTQQQFDALKAQAEKQWTITPPEVQQLCRNSVDLVQLDGCLIQLSIQWANLHPNDPLKWMPGVEQ